MEGVKIKLVITGLSTLRGATVVERTTGDCVDGPCDDTVGPTPGGIEKLTYGQRVMLVAGRQQTKPATAGERPTDTVKQ